MQVILMIKEFKLTTFKVKLKEIIIEPGNSIVEIGGVTVDDEMIGQKAVYLHEPVCIEWNSLSDFTCRQILLFGEVLLII